MASGGNVNTNAMLGEASQRREKGRESRQITITSRGVGGRELRQTRQTRHEKAGG